MRLIEPKVVTVAKRRFELGRDGVEDKMRAVHPEPISELYVVIGDRRFPPKQVISAVTGIDRADFTSHQARRVLTGLGFAAGRIPRDDLLTRERDGARRDRDAGAPTRGSGADGTPMRPSAASLEPFIGKWVATRGSQVLVAAEDPRTVVSWLAEHRQQAESMFRVPEDEYQAGGLAPS
jgi:hypothetical protein